MDIKPIRTEADYETALEKIDRLWGAEYGSPAGDTLDILVTLVEAYEEEHHPIVRQEAGRLRLILKLLIEVPASWRTIE